MKVTRSELIEVFEVIFKRKFSDSDEISQDTLAEWDSIKHLDIIMVLEESFNMDFDFETISLMTSFDFILAVLNE